MNPFNLIKQKKVINRKLEESAYEKALSEFQAGQIRKGIMAKAFADCGGDESKAKAMYIQMVAKVILDENFIDQQANSTNGEGSMILSGAMSLLIPGLGQLVQGRNWIALGFFISALAFWVILLGWIIHIWSMLNAAKYVKTQQEFSSKSRNLTL